AARNDRENKKLLFQNELRARRPDRCAQGALFRRAALCAQRSALCLEKRFAPKVWLASADLTEVLATVSPEAGPPGRRMLATGGLRRAARPEEGNGFWGGSACHCQGYGDALRRCRLGGRQRNRGATQRNAMHLAT